jgi:hypothetical protein
VDLRARRDHPAVHRHQADRPGRPQPAGGLTATPAIGQPHLALAPRRLARPPLLLLRARLRSRSLDRELARGVPSWSTPLHAARAVALTERRHRAALAGCLDRLLDHASRPASHFIGCAVVPPCREQVWNAMPELLAIAARLRGPSPVAARGVALLLELLRDGAGPCYRSTHPRALTRALQPVARHLDTEE